MKKLIVGVFLAREDAEKAINRIHNETKIGVEDISYLYSNTEGDVQEVSAGEVASATTAEGAAKGATVGGTLGALIGIAAVAGMIPAVGPFIAAGSLATLVGATSAIGATAVGTAAGAALGGIVGALMNLGVGQERAQHYSDRIIAGDVLVTVHTEKDELVAQILDECGALDIDTVEVA